MILDEFILKFKDQFIDADEITVNAETEFRQLSTWDSLTGMSILVMIKDEYAVDMADADLKMMKTVGDIFTFIRNIKGE